MVTQAETDHWDPALGAFLNLLDADIRTGHRIRALPEDLFKAVLANAGYAVDLSEDINGDVAI